MKRTHISALLTLLLISILACAACDGRKPTQPEPQPVIIEPGIPQPEQPEAQPEPEQEPEPEPEKIEFTDNGRASTLDDLMVNKEQIESYYFEQTLNYSGGNIHRKTWYYDGTMKIESSYPGVAPTVDYYDCYEHIMVSHSPALGNNAMMVTYEAGDPELPDNPLDYDYHDYRVLDTEDIDGQICRVMENRDGIKLWVSTKYGFPIQVEFTDSLTEEHFTVPYENLVINQVTLEDVLMPEDLVIYEVGR